MKILTIILSCLLMIATSSAYSQSKTISRDFPLPSRKKLSMELKFADSIFIKAHNADHVQLKAIVTVNSGKLNDAFLLESTTEPNLLFIKTDWDAAMLKKGSIGDCPGADKANGITYYNGQGYVCSHIRIEIAVPRNAELKVSSISGNIEVHGMENSLEAKSISGFVDVAWPDKNGAEVSLKTINGEIFSNLPVVINNNDSQAGVGSRITGKLGDGRKQVRIESISGNLFFRKQ